MHTLQMRERVLQNYIHADVFEWLYYVTVFNCVFRIIFMSTLYSIGLYNVQRTFLMDLLHNR